MKILITVLLVVSTLTIFGQTTEAEYNYVTKGYKIQLESGLDMKKGYSFKDAGSWGVNYGSFERTTTFKLLFRDGESIPCATLMILKRSDTDYEDYFCIPHYDSSDEIWNKAFKDFSAITNWNSVSRGYTWGLIKMISFVNSGKK